jgi:hypothetical protein
VGAQTNPNAELCSQHHDYARLLRRVCGGKQQTPSIEHIHIVNGQLGCEDGVKRGCVVFEVEDEIPLFR